MKHFIADEQVGTGLKSQIPLLVRLAHGGYFDAEGRIKGPSGFVEGSNVGKLVAFACRQESQLIGLEEFSLLLQGLGIDKLPNGNF